MILDLIKYTLDQNHSNFSIEIVDTQLLRLNIKNKKFIIYFHDVTSSGTGRNVDELRIQLSPAVKHKLIGFNAEDYKVILLGYHKITNTFTFWRYGYEIETNTQQSLYTKRQILAEAKLEGFAKYYSRKRNAFNNREHDQKNSSVSVNAFLFPLIIKNYDKIFNREFLDDFGDKIRRFNYPYSKDDLLLALGIYVKDRNTKNVAKTDPDLEKITNLCKLRFKLLGFNPLNKFYPKKDVITFRNSNGISTKTQNFKKTDPNVKGGYPGGARGPQEKLFNQYFDNNILDKKKIIADSNDLKKKILSDNIEILVGKKLFEEKKDQVTFSNIDIISDIENISDLSNFVLDKPYENRVIDPDNIPDPIESLNLSDKSNELHEKTLNELAHIFNKNKLIIKKDQHIDFYSEFKGRGKLFEVKSFNKKNFNQQIRHGIIQLREYYFIYAKYLQKIPLKTDLFLLLSGDPKDFIKNQQIEFLKDQMVTLCWIENEKVITLNKEIILTSK
tara:strand:+ start:1706 stop:3208 length:1503 start_codon:yes stop_codon:yes gene_type:complete